MSPSPILQSGSAAATIHNIPNELILEVIAYLHALDAEERTLASLLALSKTSKRLNRLVVQELYTTFSTWDHEPYLFLRTLLSNPHLAKSVKHANVPRRTTEGCETRHIPDSQDRSIIEEGFRLAGFANWEQLAGVCNGKDADCNIICAAIVQQTPNLISLEIDFRSERAISDVLQSAWISLLEQATSTLAVVKTPSFRHLLSVSITCQNWAIGKISPLFHLPSLQDLWIHCTVVADEGEERGAETLRKLVLPRCNNLKSIRFDSCFIQADMLAILIASAKELKTFWYKILLKHQDFELKDQSKLADMKLNEMLDIHKHSLETLIIDDSETDTQSLIGLGLQQGLRQFTALKDLCCPLNRIICPGSHAMSLAEKLPPSLFGFGPTISRHKKDLDLLGALENLSKVYKQHTPFLEFVWLDIKAWGPKLRYQ
jgi:hypothetical protein